MSLRECLSRYQEALGSVSTSSQNPLPSGGRTSQRNSLVLDANNSLNKQKSPKRLESSPRNGDARCEGNSMLLTSLPDLDQSKVVPMEAFDNIALLKHSIVVSWQQ